jgi:integrase
MPKKLTKTFTPPVIYPKGTTEKNVRQDAYVQFRFYDHDKEDWTQPIRRKPTLPGKYNKKEHYASLKALAEVLHEQLKDGWNPLDNSYPDNPNSADTVDDEIAKLKNLGFAAALQYAYEQKKKDWDPKSISDYKSTLKYLTAAAKGVKLDKKPMKDFELPHLVMVLNKVAELRKLSNTGFNKYRTHLSTLVTELIQWQVVKINLVYHVKQKKVPKKSQFHRPPSKHELNLIAARLRTLHYNYFRFLCCIYACGLRPHELVNMRIKDLRKIEQVFRIEDSKTGEQWESVVPNWLMKILLELDLHKYPSDYYIFASRSTAGKTFTPGPTRMHSNTPHTNWNRIIKQPVEKGGMGLNITQYAFKKLGGDAMVRLQAQFGVDKLLELPQSQMGHTSSKMTEVYVSEHIDVKKRLLKERMPEL